MRTMNAAEIILEISRLPEDKKGKVVEFVRQLPNAETLAAMVEPSENLPRFDSVEDLFSELDS